MKKTFNENDVIGPFTILGFAGTNKADEQPMWLTTSAKYGELEVRESRLLQELRKATLTPEYIQGLSSQAYESLRKEVGDKAIDAVMGRAKKIEALPAEQQKILSQKWFQIHPQIPLTRENTKLFDDFLSGMSAPTFTSRDFDLAFASLFSRLELDADAAGLTGGIGRIRGWDAISKLTADQVRQLEQPVMIPRPQPEYGKLSVEDVVNLAGETTKTADEFLEATRKIDKQLNIPQPVPPLLQSARDRTMGTFFECNPTVQDTPELRAALIKVCDENHMGIVTQALQTALEILVEQSSPLVVHKTAGHEFGSTRWIKNEPRQGPPLPQFDIEPITVTLKEIQDMPGDMYARRLLEPAFRAAVDRLLNKFGSSTRARS